jgi:branched-chain amino acid transport system substrate-binding protein
MQIMRRPIGALAAVALCGIAAPPASAAEPIKIGFSMAMTGGVAQNGKQLLIALQLWRDDVNAKGGLLGRPVEFVYYDDDCVAKLVFHWCSKILRAAGATFV